MKSINRRKFLGAVSAATAGIAASGFGPVFANSSDTADKLAALGGSPVRSNKSFPAWPYVDENMEAMVVKSLRARRWCRHDWAAGTGNVAEFEKEWAAMNGSKYCVATSGGTQALSASVIGLGIGPGDEVITAPYSDMGTIASIIVSRALPVMVDLDRESFQLDPAIVAKRINANTKAIMPVHIGGQPCDLDSIMALARKHNLYVIEDACQAHLAEYRGKRLGTVGDVGCFSHQASKNLPSCGEGGSIIGNDEELMNRCYIASDRGASRRRIHEGIGTNYRMNELQGATLLAQMPTVLERHKLRNENAAYLTEKLKACPGVIPQKLYPGFESGSWHLYMMSYRKEHFNNVSREIFLKALAAEGIWLSPYIGKGLNTQPWVDHILGLKAYTKMFSPARLKQYRAELPCPVCDKICSEEMLMTAGAGPMLGTKEDMDDIANAIIKLYQNKDQLTKVTV